MPTAFQGPLKLKQRLGTLDPAQIAATDPARLEEVFREKPAIHRFPGNMARRVQDLASVVVEEYGGDAERVWRDAADGADLRKRISGLPGFGEMKVKALGAVLGKRFGVPAAEELDAGPPDARRRRLARGARGVPGEEARVQGRAARSAVAEARARSRTREEPAALRRRRDRARAALAAPPTRCACRPRRSARSSPAQPLEPQRRQAAGRAQAPAADHRLDRRRRPACTPTSARASGRARRSGSRSTSSSRKTPRAKVSFEYADESDQVGYPIPKRVHIEGGSDHHALLLDRDACRLYELGGLEQQGGRWHAWAGATWSLRSNRVRPAGWTSADAAGLPIFPGLARYDEAQARRDRPRAPLHRPADAPRLRLPGPPLRELRSPTRTCRRWACACA